MIQSETNLIIFVIFKHNYLLVMLGYKQISCRCWVTEWYVLGTNDFFDFHTLRIVGSFCTFTVVKQNRPKVLECSI